MNTPALYRFFDKHYFFGDSLCDVNNFASLETLDPNNSPILRRPLYNDGRFTNGNSAQGVWTDYYSQRLRLSINSFYPTTFNQGDLRQGQGINFALGGDKSDAGNISPINNHGLSQQVNLFNGLVAQGVIQSLGDSIVINWIGANDYLEAAFSPAPIEVIVEQVVDNITNSLSNVLNQGVRFVVVPNIIDLGLTPLARANQVEQRLADLSIAHNEALAESLEGLRQSYPGAKIIEVDVYNFYNNQIYPRFRHKTTPATTTNLYPTPLLPQGVDLELLMGIKDYDTVSNAANRYLWWDTVHPTTRVHRLVSNYILQVIEENIAMRGTPRRDNLTGTAENNLFIGSLARDTLTGGGGEDVFVYNHHREVRDRITDFIVGEEVGEDRLNLIGALRTIGYRGVNPLRTGHISFRQRGSDTIVNLDTNGSRPGGLIASLTLENVETAAINNLANFIF